MPSKHRGRRRPSAGVYHPLMRYPNLRHGVPLFALIAAAGLLAGCGSYGTSGWSTGDNEKDIINEQLSTGERAAAVERLWRSQADGDHAAARESLKRIAWKASNIQAVRLQALRLLLEDECDTNNADSRNMFRLMIAIEPDLEVVNFLATAAADRGWTEFGPPIVRSFARQRPNRPDRDRPEFGALQRLFPSQPVERSVYAVFATPVTATGQERERQERARLDAWALLARLDPDGSARMGFIAEPVPSDDALVVNVRTIAAELRCVPITAPQLRWLTELRNESPQRGPDAATRRQWWAQTRSAVSGLSPEQVAGLQLRALEPIRWASLFKPEYLSLDRRGIESTLAQRFAGRSTTQRVGATFSGNAGNSERLQDNLRLLAWSDLLTILVIDDVLRQPGLLESFIKHAEDDRKDTSTEFGGLLISPADVPLGETYQARLFAPRATERHGDERFVASDELFAAGPLALAHFHFHAQRVDNREFAGPGPGDLEFAQAHGRACLVITPIGRSTLNIDYFQAGGAKVDLGDFAPATSAK